MNNEKFNRCALLLNSLQSMEDGKQLADEIGRLFNCYGNYSSLSRELSSRLTAAGNQRLRAIVSLAALQMSHEWEKGRFDSWDDRKKASLSFSYNNSAYFERMFEREAGFPLEVSVEKGFHFLDCLNYLPLKGTYLEGFLYGWVNMHSTLKQSFFGGFVTGVLHDSDFVPPLNYSEVTFPFM